MSSTLYDTLAEQMHDGIKEALRKVQVNSEDNDIKTAIERIIPTGSSNISLTGTLRNRGKKSPDKSYRYKGCKFPSLVIEIAYSQRKLNLPDLAERYIYGSEGDIRTVIGINLNDIYQSESDRKKGKHFRPSAATISVWRAKFDDSGGESSVIVAQPVKDIVFFYHSQTS